ncbi:MAG: PaREP1 family protein, partial [Actinobacteria bacterium]|nr:PaREP1 family protein [Actinomycetota bacterium]
KRSIGIQNTDYKKQSEKYFSDAKKLLAKKDFAQASEKLWGASATMVKAVAENYKLYHNGHRELFKVIDTLTKKTKDDELLTLFHIASSLHINFYENWLTEKEVKNGYENIEKLLKKLNNLIKQ